MARRQRVYNFTVRGRRYDRPLRNLEELRELRRYSLREVADRLNQLRREVYDDLYAHGVIHEEHWKNCPIITPLLITFIEDCGTPDLTMLRYLQCIYSQPTPHLRQVKDNPATFLVPFSEILRLNLGAPKIKTNHKMQDLWSLQHVFTAKFGNAFAPLGPLPGIVYRDEKNLNLNRFNVDCGLMWQDEDGNITGF